MVSFSSRIYFLVFCLDNLSVSDRGVFKSLTTTVLESICAFKSFNVCLMKLGALTLTASRLIIVISFWCIAPFISIKWLSLSHLTNVNLKSTLTKYCYSCLFSEPVSLVNLLPAFHPKPVLISVNNGFSIFLLSICQMVTFDGRFESKWHSISIFCRHVVNPAI
jgi:hypothetical protein